MFWDFYALCYDTLLGLAPYRTLVHSMVSGTVVGSSCRILDAGCGTGNLALGLAQAARPEQRASGALHIDAVDTSTAMMVRALRKSRHAPEIHYSYANLASRLAAADGTYDRIVCCNVLYAVPDPLATLCEFRRLLKPGGRLVLSTPGLGVRPGRLLAEHFGTLHSISDWLSTLLRIPLIVAVQLMNVVIRKRAREQVYHFMNQGTLAELLGRAGFSVCSLQRSYAGQNWLAVAELAAVPADPGRPG